MVKSVISVILLFLSSNHYFVFANYNRGIRSRDITFSEYSLDPSTTLSVCSTNTHMTVVMEAIDQAWLGVGVSKTGDMTGGIGIIGSPSVGVQKYDLIGKGLGGVLLSEEQTLVNTSFTQDTGGSHLAYTQSLLDEKQVVEVGGEVTFIWAVGRGNALGYHGPKRGNTRVRLTPC